MGSIEKDAYSEEEGVGVKSATRRVKLTRIRTPCADDHTLPNLHYNRLKSRTQPLVVLILGILLWMDRKRERWTSTSRLRESTDRPAR